MTIDLHLKSQYDTPSPKGMKILGKWIMIPLSLHQKQRKYLFILLKVGIYLFIRSFIYLFIYSFSFYIITICNTYYIIIIIIM